MQNKKGWLSLCFVFGLLLALSVQAAPFVSNVVGAQRAGTKLVDITYDLTDADHATLSVTIKISHDAGATWNVPCTSLSGDGIGPEVTPGKGKSIVWDAGADWNGQWSNQMKVQITATASTAPPASGMYMVVDLSMGPKAASFPVSYLDGGARRRLAGQRLARRIQDHEAGAAQNPRRNFYDGVAGRRVWTR